MIVFCLLLAVVQVNSFTLRFNRQATSETGRFQSPIAVDLTKTKYITYPPFVFAAAYKNTMPLRVFNRNGETVSITPLFANSSNLTVSGGCLQGQFTFISAHLHWPQSEHTFSKINYIAEAHFIHKNLETNQIAVFAYFFTSIESQSEESDNTANSWEIVLQNLKNDTNVTIPNGLSSFMIGQPDRFIHYNGSFTTEPFTEGVLWILIPSSMKLSSASLDRLRTNIVPSNYRQTQLLNDRTIHRNFLKASWPKK